MADDKKFRDKTRDALHDCAKWLDEHADELATKFAGDEIGCKSWSLSFSFNSDGLPGVIVDTDNKCTAIVMDTITSTEYY